MEFDVPDYITLITTEMSEDDKKVLSIFLSVLESKRKLQSIKGFPSIIA
jgi:hypothetical protein